MAFISHCISMLRNGGMPGQLQVGQYLAANFVAGDNRRATDVDRKTSVPERREGFRAGLTGSITGNKDSGDGMPVAEQEENLRSFMPLDRSFTQDGTTGFSSYFFKLKSITGHFYMYKLISPLFFLNMVVAGFVLRMAAKNSHAQRAQQPFCGVPGAIAAEGRTGVMTALTMCGAVFNSAISRHSTTPADQGGIIAAGSSWALALTSHCISMLRNGGLPGNSGSVSTLPRTLYLAGDRKGALALTSHCISMLRNGGLPGNSGSVSTLQRTLYLATAGGQQM